MKGTRRSRRRVLPSSHCGTHNGAFSGGGLEAGRSGHRLEGRRRSLAEEWAEYTRVASEDLHLKVRNEDEGEGRGREIVRKKKIGRAEL